MDTQDWRDQLLPQIRQIKVHEIMEELNFFQQHNGGGELLEVQRIAQCYEQKIYTGAASEEEYTTKISSAMLSLSQKYWRSLLQPESGQRIVNWRSLLQPESRQRMINKILEILRRHLPVYGRGGLNELRKIAERFEGKIFDRAISEADYLRKISLKMLTMESRNQNARPNPLPSNFGYNQIQEVEHFDFVAWGKGFGSPQLRVIKCIRK